MFDPSTLTLVATVGLIVLTVGAAGAWYLMLERMDRLPAATRLADIRERLALAQAELRRTEEARRELDRQIHDRDRLAAEVAHLRELIDTLKLEQENLAPAREEIEEVKRQAAEAARQKAEIEAELQALREALAQLREELDPDRIETLRQRKAEAEAELARVQGELDRLRPALDAALRHLTEAREAEARVAALATRMDELKGEADALRTEQAALAQQRDALQAEVAAARSALESARAAQHDAETRRQEIEARIAALEENLDQLRRTSLSVGTGSAAAPADPAVALADLVAPPACLATPARLRGAARQESEALHGVARYLEDSGLSFARRTLHAFHTALKVNDTAQLTVLAGVSGTGKSLLPRRYAEAMGIHFLQVAVEPRWDSPQDLLGFYNYVEGKYRATELARLMAHLDPWQSLPLPEGTPDRRNRMALVLLDEMNLARVEYYFSEFLSRLEARPAWRPGLRPEDCKDSLIPVDIRGMADPPRLFPAHNILFVGTMNDDESTQSLSDKVLDRGNILQFPAPAEFPARPARATGTPAAEAQRFDEWRSWVRDAEALPRSQADADLVQRTVSDLSRIMQGFGRPFGHRLNRAIRAYAANYPFEGNAPDLRVPLADQVEFRILPKLRGIEIDSHRAQFESLIDLIRTRLDDSRLADRLADTCEDQARGSNLFFWRGLMRQD